MKQKTQYVNRHLHRKPEVNNSPSMTIPDESLSVREIMERYARGLPLQGVRVPEYHGEDDDLPDLERMELTDRMDAIEQAKIDLKEMKDKISKKKEKPEKQAKKPLKQEVIDFVEVEEEKKDQKNDPKH